jgi:hypothetical protein
MEIAFSIHPEGLFREVHPKRSLLAMVRANWK